MKVKICGITNLEDALLCEEQGADALGFIFYKRSKRYIDLEDASNIIKRLSFFTQKIGVFVDEKEDLVNLIAEKLKLTGVQISGDESPEYVKKINIQAIKSFRITKSFNYNIIADYEYITPLLDKYKRGEYGGTGEVFDWAEIPGNISKTVIVAGGVSENNIENIYNIVNPLGIDLSSSVEKYPGKKDEIKVKSFFKKINKLRSAKWSL